MDTDKEQTLRDFIESPNKVSKMLGLSSQTVRVWLEMNAVPPKHVIRLANALDVEIYEILQFANKASKKVQTARKTEADLDAILAAYNGEPYKTTLSERSITLVLSRWGDRVPLLHSTLKKLNEGVLTLDDAATALGINKTSVHNLRNRYGMAPGPLKPAKKDLGRYKLSAKKIAPLTLAVIAGRKTAKAAAEEAEIPLRTLHRHIKPALDPLTLNEISHWSKGFRAALAVEVQKKCTKYTVLWRKWAQDRGLVLQKKPKWPKEPSNWRDVGVTRMLIAVLVGERSVEELAVARGGSPTVIDGLIKKELVMMGMNPMALSLDHQLAVAEIALARLSHFREHKKHD